MTADSLREDLFATFTASLSAAGGVTHRATSFDGAARTIQGIVQSIGTTLWTSSRLIETHPALVDTLRDIGYDIRVPTDPADVRDQPIGLTTAKIGIAETGSLLLDEPDLNDRAVSLMTNLLIAICSIGALKPTLDDAAPVLRDISTSGPSYATFVTGPSRTADIERQLTIGVQGPAAMHVVFIP